MVSGRINGVWSSAPDKEGLPFSSKRGGLVPRRSQFSRYRIPLLLISILGIASWLLFTQSTSDQCSATSRFCTSGPKKGPLKVSANELADLVRTNIHPSIPQSLNLEDTLIPTDGISIIDLNWIKSTPEALKRKERVLILTPLKDAALFLSHYFNLLSELTYPHELIDLAFLVSDSVDDTIGVLTAELKRIQNSSPEKQRFRTVTIVKKDFGIQIGQDVRARHEFRVQGERRMAMAKARNYLLATALRGDHSWVYWRDVDIEQAPATIVEDFIEIDKDVVVPNIWFHRYEDVDGKIQDIEGRFDYNSWQETPESREFRKSVSSDVILAEGYKQYPTKRNHMALMGTSGPTPAQRRETIELDGIGGVSIMVKAEVHRAGINFPAYAFENQAETEGFAQMAKKAGYGVFGLPNYIVWHMDTDEKAGNV